MRHEPLKNGGPNFRRFLGLILLSFKTVIRVMGRTLLTNQRLLRVDQKLRQPKNGLSSILSRKSRRLEKRKNKKEKKKHVNPTCILTKF